MTDLAAVETSEVGITADKALARVKALYKILAYRRPEVDRHEDYFDGHHPLVYASDQFREIHRHRYKGFSDNWCGVVGRAPVERTELIGFGLGDDTEPLSDDERGLWRDWERNEGPAQMSQGFLTKVVAKRSFVLVWGDEDDNPVLTWEHPSQVVVDYDPDNPRMRRDALKVWCDDDGDKEYATYYTPDEVWKWERPASHLQVRDGRTESGLIVVSSYTDDAGQWKPRQPDGDDTWPLDNPMGRVPIVEFVNRPRLRRGPLSDIAGTMAMQDAINLLWSYLFNAADFASMPARVVMGQEPPKIPILDDAGQQIGEKPVDQEALTKGRMLWLTGQSTSIGQWDAAKLDVFTNVVNVSVRHIAAQTATPIYLIHGELGNVNGETLTGLDAPLVSKVREGHKFDEPAVREVFRLMALVRGNDSLAESCRDGLVRWANAETRSDAQVSDAALKDKQIGWSFQGILERRYGMGADEIKREMDRRAADPTLTQTAVDPNAAPDATAGDVPAN